MTTNEPVATIPLMSNSERLDTISINDNPIQMN